MLVFTPRCGEEKQTTEQPRNVASVEGPDRHWVQLAGLASTQLMLEEKVTFSPQFVHSMKSFGITNLLIISAFHHFYAYTNFLLP